MPGDASSLEDLIGEFERALNEIQELAIKAATSELGRGSDIAVMQLAETASDVVAAGRVLAAAERRAAAAMEVEIRRVRLVAPDRSAEWIVSSQSREFEELRVALKGWFFFVRALCDNVYRLLLASATSRPAPFRGSMNKAASNPENPVALLLADRAPSFVPWFIAFRDKRNEIKDGVNFGFTDVTGPGLAATFFAFTTGRGLSIDLSETRTVTVPDVVEGAQRLVEALAVLAGV